MGNLLEAGPEGRASHLSDHFGGHAQRLRQERRNSVSTAPVRHKLGEMCGQARRQRRTPAIDDEWRLVQHQLGDGQTVGCGVEGKHCARRPAHDERRSAGLADESVEILDLALHCVLRRIVAVASPSTVVCEDGEARGQER